MFESLFLLPFSPPDSWQDIHPILVNFTAALFPASIGSDLLGKALRRQSLSDAAVVDALLRGFDYAFTLWPAGSGKSSLDVATAPPDDIIFLHQWLGSSLAVVFIILAIWRGRFHLSGEVPSIAYFFLAIVVLVLLIYQGSLGGMMVFGG